MIVTIDGINRKMIETKYGEKESVGIVPLEDKVTDINGDEFEMNDRWLNGFRDKAGETDQWVKGMKVKVQIEQKKYKRKDGSEGEALNFRLPEGTTSIVEQPKEEEPEVINRTSAVDPDDF